MFRNSSVDVRQFAMVPRSEIPRSSFKMQSAHKTTFDAGYLVPIYVDEVLPGDSFSLKMTAFARMQTPIVPIMDNIYLDSFFFFVPYRLVWSNWKKFMGEQDNPGDSTSYLVPVIQNVAANGVGYQAGTLANYMGLPANIWPLGAGGSGNLSHSALPFRAYNLIWNEWFRDENLQNSVPKNMGDGPDAIGDYELKRRGKRHDYFTSALPWPQKGGTAVSLPLGTTAAVKSIGNAPANSTFANAGANTQLYTTGLNVATGGFYADLSTATSATINQLRQAFQIQKLLERDARGGTRYTEIVRSHFGVISPDARLQRPEYLGGGSTPVNVNPIAQTSGTGVTGGTTPLGTLSAMGTALAQGHGFSQSFTEHGVIIGLVNVRADLGYQSGMRKMWSRRTRYDFYFPAFAHLGEQAILNKELHYVGAATDEDVFGYQERWAEYRYKPSLITGMFNSHVGGTLDYWHMAQKFTSVPTLNDTFIQDTPPMSRILALGTNANQMQFLFDSFFDVKAARPLPMYSQPGLIDHF